MRHVDLLKRLLPLVSIDPNGPEISIELEAEGKALDEAQAFADQLLLEMDPRTCSLTLIDWERVYDLPDRCVTAVQSVDQRRASLISLVSMQGGQSRQFFIDLADAMGYPGATIDEFRPMTCNDNCNSALWSETDRFTWQVNLPYATGGVFVANCNSVCDSPLQSWGDEAVECRINRFKPAHTTAVFAYV